MDIREILNEQCIELNLPGKDKQSVIKNLIKILAKHNLISDEDEFLKTVWEREQTYSTGIGMGIAVPHGKSNAVLRPAIAFGKTNEGIEFQSLDGKPANIFFLIAVPEESHNLHLQLLSILSRKLMHQEVRDALNKAKTPGEVLSALEMDIEVG
jgi:PTS system nitrogen regulatory IIA component